MATPVLMYHAVTDADERSIPTEELPYTVTLRSFREQMSYLQDNGIESCLLNDEHEPAGRSVVITFDDGHVTDYLNALPLLTDMQLKAEFYVTTGWIAKQGYMDVGNIRELHDAGMTVGTHGINHHYFDDMTATEFRDELRDSTSRLEDIVGHKIDCGSAPGGRLHSNAGIIAAELGYRYLCTSEVGVPEIPIAPDFQMFARLVVGRTTTLPEFAKLVSADRKTILLRQTKVRMLRAAKRILGNRRYDRIRARLLGEAD